MENRVVDKALILNLVFGTEAILLLLATFWIHFSGMQLLSQFHANRGILLIGVTAGGFISLVGFLLLWLASLPNGAFNALRKLKAILTDELRPLFRQFTFSDILLVSATAGFCEEVFFRGVVQAQFGLVAASILFALLHCPSSRHITYGIWAFSASIFLGLLLTWQQSLWAPIVAHTTSNIIVLLYLRSSIKIKEQ